MIFAISLCLNLALAGAAVRLWNKPVAAPPPPLAASGSRIGSASVAVASSNPTAPTVVTYVTNHFEWARVESEDWEQLADNLRVVGCPEKTIRDVVIARARRTLERVSRRATARLPFWAGGLRREQANREATRAATQAREQIVSRAEHVVSRDGWAEGGRLMEDFVDQAITRFVIGPMPEKTFLRLTATIAGDATRRDELKARSRGVWLEEDDLALEQIRAQYQRDLATVLSPEELEEFRARLAMMKPASEVQFDATDLTPTEVRQIALITARFQDPTLEGWFSSGEITEEQEAGVKTAVREYLGEARYAQFERAADSDFKSLFALGRDNNLRPDAAMKAYEISKLTRQEVTRLREDKSLSNAERGERLAQVQEATATAVLQALGARACQEYLQRGGSWVTNVSGL